MFQEEYVLCYARLSVSAVTAPTTAHGLWCVGRGSGRQRAERVFHSVKHRREGRGSSGLRADREFAVEAVGPQAGVQTVEF